MNCSKQSSKLICSIYFRAELHILVQIQDDVLYFKRVFNLDLKAR
jgi:hypothetical protein